MCNIFLQELTRTTDSLEHVVLTQLLFVLFFKDL